MRPPNHLPPTQFHGRPHLPPDPSRHAILRENWSGKIDQVNTPPTLLPRLRSALPLALAWIDDYIAKHARAACDVYSLGIDGLSAIYPATLLRSAHVVAVDHIVIPQFNGLAYRSSQRSTRRNSTASPSRIAISSERKNRRAPACIFTNWYTSFSGPA